MCFKITQEEKVINEINNLFNSLYLLESVTHLDKFRLRVFLMLRNFESQIQQIPFHEVIKMQSASLPEIWEILKKFRFQLKANYKPRFKPVHNIEPTRLMQMQALINDTVEVPGQYDVNHVRDFIL